MRLPPVHIVSQSDYFVSGDVFIHETAVVAPGVILQAAPNSQIHIGEGVCIGMGTVLNAYGGTITLEQGVTLGPGVLMIGRCSVGEGACIGQTTTIINTTIEALSLIPAGSLLGDTSRPWQGETTSEKETLPSPWDTEEETEKAESPPHRTAKPESQEATIQEAVESAETIEFVSTIPNTPDPPVPVIGQVYINQLLVTLFPERQAFKQANLGSS